MPVRIDAASLGGIPIQLDILARDYESLREVTINLAAQLTPEWTDFFEGDPGVVLIEINAYIGGIQSYGLDRIQNEAYLATAQLRSSVVHLLRLIDYELSAGSAASVIVVVQTSGAVILPAGWALQSEASPTTPALRFELLQPVTLGSAGYWTTTIYAPTLAIQIGGSVNTNDDLIIVHGESIIGELVGTSDGTANQVFELAETPLALNPDGTSPLIIYVSAVPWTQVDSFIDSEPTDEHFKITLDASGVIEAEFGDGVNGKKPPFGAAITSDYRIGGGAVGNSVGVQALLTQVVPVAGVLQAYNPVQPGGGTEPETIEHAKRFGPLSLRALNRAVTLEDFETLAKTVAGVRAARAAHITGPFTVDIFIASEGANPVPTGTWYPQLDTGSGLIGAVGRFLTERKPVPTVLQIFGPTVVRPFLQATIYVLKNILRTDARFEVERRLLEFFQNLTDDFGISVPLSRVVQVIENTRGVDWVQMVAMHRKPQARFVNGNRLAFDSAAFSVTGITQTTTFERYTILWLNGNTYKLIGDTYGVITDADNNALIFTEGVDYDIDHFPPIPSETVRERSPQFRINVDLLGPFVFPSDKWTFATDNFLGNIAIDEFEMVVPTVTISGGLDPTEFVLTFGGGIG